MIFRLAVPLNVHSNVKLKGSGNREEKFWQKLQIFQQNIFDPTLRTHKLSGKLKELWSFSIEYDLRIIFYFAAENKVVFIDIGTHNEVY